MPEESFKLVLRKSSSLTPSTRSKEELLLEYKQAMLDYIGGAFLLDASEGKDGTVTEEEDEVWDIAACAAFKDAFDRRLAEAASEEEEGGLTAERSRELQRMLEHNIQDIEASDLVDKEGEYLPKTWWVDGEPTKGKLAEWRDKISKRFHDILVRRHVHAVPSPQRSESASAYFLWSAVHRWRRSSTTPA